MVIEYFLEWVKTASVAKRAEAASALVRAFLRNDISDEEREDVEAALTTLLDDPASCVRMAMAEAFGARKIAPRHIISALSADVLDVSIITLSQSPVLHDTELAEVMFCGADENQIAVACRPWISAHLLSAISHHGCEDACMAALTNPAADFTQDNLHVVAQRFGTGTDIRRKLLEREDLAAETRLILIDKLGASLSGLVASRGWMRESKVKTVVDEACEKASISFVANASDDDVRHLVRNMIDNGKITVSYLLRAVCMGNISLVAQAFSELSGVRMSRVETILMKDRKSAFKALYDRAELPQSAFVIFQTAIASWRRLLSSNADINEARLSYLVTREVLDTYTGLKDQVVDDLILLLRKLSAEAARESAKVKAAEIARRAEEVEAAVEIEENTLALENGVATIAGEQVSDVISETSDTEAVVNINTEAFMADFSDEMQKTMELAVLDSMDEAADKVANSADVYAFVDAEIIEDDYRPDISVAIMNAAMVKAA